MNLLSRLIVFTSITCGAIGLLGCSGGSKEGPLQVEGGLNSGGTAGGEATGSAQSAMQAMPNVVPSPDGK
jgi:hypothetical protein